MATPYLILTDSLGTPYSFPASLFLADDSSQMRSSIQDLVYAHGGKQVADGFVAPRKVSITGDFYADSGVAFETAWRALVKAIFKGGKLTIFSDTVPRYIEVANPAIDSEWEHWPNFKRLTITFNAAFPFWVDETELNPHDHMAGAGNMSPLDLTASEHIVLPTIEIAADQGANLPSIRLTNPNDSGKTLRYDNPAFLIGSTLIINAGDGTIKLNGNDAIEYFVSGAFLRLQPKVNTIAYVGNACTITVKYRRLYL